MSKYYNKDELKTLLNIEYVYELLNYWDGNPSYQGEECIISDTICHNLPNEGSHKLYYYNNTRLFHCYTGCEGEDSFDVFELCIKVMKNQKDLEWELYDAMDYIASYFGFDGIEASSNEQELQDWEIFKRHKFSNKKATRAQLKEYDPIILTRFQYPRIIPWEQEGISATVIKDNLIGYYPGGEQITIPHFDKDGKLIGIRGRYLSTEMADRFGKYRPLLVNKKLYNHPLSLNLYNLNNSRENIKKSRIAIVFEGEKSALAYQSYYGKDNDISTACCGSSLSAYQVELLKDLGAREIIVAFDRQFQEIGDDEFKKLKAKLIHIYNKYNKTIKITAIFDKSMILPYKASPIDVSKELFEKLLSERIVPHD